MSARFLLGRAGTGKTAWCMQRTIAACRSDALGPPIVWIVPRQATFQIERDLCCGPQLSGFFRVQVMSFELLCRQVLLESGGAGGTAADVGHAGRQMILGHLLRKHQNELRFFRSVAALGGLAAEMDATLDELERGGADVANLAAQLPDPANSALLEKARDLQLIQTAYNAFLGEQRLDPAARVRQAMESFPKSKLLMNATVYVDGFLHFTQRERGLLAALACVGPDISIALTLDPDSDVARDPHHLPGEDGLFHSMELGYRKLWFKFQETGVKIEPAVELRVVRRLESAGLRSVQAWSGGGGGGGDGVEFIEAPNHRAEADAAAGQVRDWVRQGGRYRDIAVLARQLGGYHDFITAAFAEHGIPFFLDQRRSASHHPLIQFLTAALSLAPESDAMMSLLKSGLCGLPAEKVDELENHLLANDFGVEFWTMPAVWGEWSDPVGRLVTPLHRFAAAARAGRTMRDFCRAMFELLEAFAVRHTLLQWIAKARQDGQIEQAAQHQQTWIEVSQLFEQMVELLGDRPIDLAEFQAIVEGSLATLEVVIVPPTVDQVLVGQVDRTRTPAVKLAIVLGLSDGQFPLPPGPTTILSDADRRSLSGIADLEPDARRRALDEEMLGYFAFTRASRGLVVTRPLTDKAGNALGPSSLWRKLRSIVPEVPVAAAPSAEQVAPADISTPRQLVTGLMLWARGVTEPAAESAWQALYQGVVERSRGGDELDRLRRLAWPALSYANKAELSRDLSHRLFPSPLRARARQLETFAACPFQHFVRYGLGLRERPRGGLGRGDEARAAQDVLLSQADCRRLRPPEVHKKLLERAARFKDPRILELPRHRHLLDRLANTLNQVIAAQCAAGRRGKFEPQRVSVAYGQGKSLAGVRAGADMVIEGFIDRVDVLPGDRAAAIYDYRLTDEALSLVEVYHGLRLELVVHLLAWSDGGGNAPPAAALVVSLSRRLADEKPADVAGAPGPGEEEFDLRVKPRGIILESFADDLDSGMEAGKKSDLLNMHRKKEGGFGYRDATDVATEAEFAALLGHVRTKLAELAERIRAGDIAVRPYRLGTSTPCGRCDFRDVCRFSPSQGYRNLTPMTRLVVLGSVTGGGGGGGE